MDAQTKLIQGETKLTQAVEMDNLALVQRLVVVEREKINEPGKCYHSGGVHLLTPLLLAVANGNSTMTDELIRLGADVNIKSDGVYPIHVACRTNKFLLINSLVQAGADVNVKDNHDYSPFMIALDKYKCMGAKMKYRTPRITTSDPSREN